MKVSIADGAATVEGDGFPVNKGQLCVKGFTSAAVLNHRERLTTPLIRKDGMLQPASWDEALTLTASRLRQVQARHGPDAAAVFGSGSLTNEKAYWLGKFARVGLGTANIDYNGRFCMSSGATAANLAFGIDRGLPFPVEDIASTEVLVLVGANVAETLPTLMQYLEVQRARGGQLIVIDPRRTLTAPQPVLHLKLIPGSDAALANGLLHLLVREELIDRRYIRERTEGFEAVKALVSGYWPERVERLTGISEPQLLKVAQTLGTAKSVMILTGRGPEQQAHGVSNALAFINLALALGKVGAQFSGWGCLTGQGNGQGGREHGQKADQLPGYRRVDDPAARAHVARVWGAPEHTIPGVGKSAYELLSSDSVKGMLVVGSNVVVSAPNALQVTQKLQGLEFLAVVDFFVSQTAALAEVVFPSAQWAEEEGTMTNLEGRVIHRRRAVAPARGVRTDLEIIAGLASALGAQKLFADPSPRAVFEELRAATRGGPADYAGISYEKIDRLNGVFWPCPTEDSEGTPRLFTERFPTPSGRARFQARHHESPAEEPDTEFPLFLTTGRVLAHYQTGTQTHRVAALERHAAAAFVQLHPSTARQYEIEDGDPVTLRTRRGSARFFAQLTRAIREDTLFVPFHWGADGSANRLTNAALDPMSRMPEFKVCAVRIEQPAFA